MEKVLFIIMSSFLIFLSNQVFATSHTTKPAAPSDEPKAYKTKTEEK